MSLRTPADDVADALINAVHRAGDVAGAWLIGYGTIRDRDTITTVAEVLDPAVPVTGQFLVTDSHYYCVAPGCTCQAGRGLHFDERITSIAASMTVEGVVALPSRKAVLALVDADPQAQTAVTKAIGDLEPCQESPSQQIRRLMTTAQTGTRLTDPETARLAIALSDPAAAQSAWTATGADMWQRDLWLDMTRRLPDSHAAPAAALAAWCAWRRGQTDLAVAALSRAQQADPSDRMTLLMKHVLHSRVGPENIPWPLPSSARTPDTADD